jgi:hypothetical protein
MADEHNQVLDPSGLAVRAVKAIRPNPPTLKQTVAGKLAQRPATTAAIAVLLGALAAEALALFFARDRTRTALRRSARANLRLTHDLDPDADLLD